MIITRTPFRVSFFGGGSDLPSWLENNKGCVISTTINKYCYINLRILHKIFEYKYRLRYYKTEQVSNINQIKHNSIRACLNYLKLHNKKIEIVHNADLPAASGLGSSSSFTVGLLNTLNILQNKKKDKNYLAKKAILIEQKILKESVGVQDQIATAFGGFNYIEFSKKNFKVNKINQERNIKKIESNCLLIFTGLQRSADPLEKKKINIIRNNKLDYELNNILEIVDEAKKNILSQNFRLKYWGDLLNEHWMFKKSLSKNVTNNKIDSIYNEMINLGAYGGKLLGAGNGGFMIFLCPSNKKNIIKKKFGNLLIKDLKFDKYGSHMIYNLPEEN